MARIQYEEIVKSNFLKPLELAKLNVDTTIKTISDTYKKIIDDSDLSSIAATRDSWLAMINTINSKSTELLMKMQAKYDDMIAKAQKFDGWARDAAGKVSDTACKIEDDTTTQQVKYFVTESSVDGEGYPTITYKKEVRAYTAVYGDATDPTKVTSYNLSDTPSTSSQVYSIKTESDYATYVTNSSSISF